jgi:hypothetical protein
MLTRGRADLTGTLAVSERGNGQPCGDLDVAGLDKEHKTVVGNGVLALVSPEYLGWPIMKLFLSISDSLLAQPRICNLQLHLYPSISLLPTLPAPRRQPSSNSPSPLSSAAGLEDPATSFLATRGVALFESIEFFGPF